MYLENTIKLLNEIKECLYNKLDNKIVIEDIEITFQLIKNNFIKISLIIFVNNQLYKIGSIISLLEIEHYDSINLLLFYLDKNIEDLATRIKENNYN